MEPTLRWKVQNSMDFGESKGRVKKRREKDKDLLNNYLVSMIFFILKRKMGK